MEHIIKNKFRWIILWGILCGWKKAW